MLPKSDIESRSSDTKVSKDGGEMNFSALKILQCAVANFSNGVILPVSQIAHDLNANLLFFLNQFARTP